MSTFQRLAKISTPFRGTMVGGLLLVLVTSFLNTVAKNMLLVALLFPVLGLETYGAIGEKVNYPPVRDFLYHQLALCKDPHYQMRLLVMLAACTILVIFLKAASEGRQIYLLNKFSNLMAREMRQRLFTHMLRLPPAHFETETTGSLLSRITGDVVVLQSSLGPQFAEALQAPVTIVLALGTMLWASWQLTLIALGLGPIIALILSVGGKKLRKLSTQTQERLGDLNSGLVERLANIRIIQSFVREPHETARVANFNQGYYKQTMRGVFIAEIIAPGIEFIAISGMVVGIVIGGLWVISGKLESPMLFLFLTQAQAAGEHFKRLSRLNQIRQQASGAAERIFDVLDVVPEIQDAPDAVALPPVEGHITFDAVHFAYANGETVLADIDFTVSPGEVIALVGPSGSGKTTLVNLLPRFYDPTAGCIRVDGHDLRAVTLASLRGQVGIVPQETVLFSGTIYENILYGKLDASEAEVSEAARAANALEFIERLPEGFQTVVGERGARLSGGQRQRVAIARALLKNPRILILDEATSALDTESEQLVQQALDRLMVGRTTFVIAHRLSTVQHATRILVLERGRIVERGTHAELLASDGLYKRLHAMQFRNRAGVAAG